MKRSAFFILLMLMGWICSPGHAQVIPVGGTPVLSESFADTLFPPPGWIADGVARTVSSGSFYSAPAAANFSGHAGSLTLPAVANPSVVQFYLGRTTSAASKMMIVEVNDGTDPAHFIQVDTFDHDNTTAGDFTLCQTDLSPFSHLPSVTIRFRKASSTTSPWRLDNIEVYATTSSLPVSLTLFHGEFNSNTGCTHLEWATETEEQNAGFTLLRGNAQHPFAPIGNVQGHGTTTMAQHYTFRDPEPLHPVSYYKLIQHDHDGRSDTLKTIRVITGLQSDLEIQSIHSRGADLMVQLSEPLTGPVNILVSDLHGRTRYQTQVNANNQKIFSLRVKLLQGVYVLYMSDSSQRVTRKFSVDL